MEGRLTMFRVLIRFVRRHETPITYYLVFIFSGLFIFNIWDLKGLGNSVRAVRIPEVDKQAPERPFICADAVRNLFKGPRTPVINKDNTKPSCKLFAAESKLERQYVENIFDHERVRSAHDVTLVTQLTISRIGRLKEVLDKWKGPVSVAFHIDEPLADVIKMVCNNKMFSERKNTYIHLMQKTGTLYPVNQLRNLALLYVTTGFAFLTDVDLIPHRNLYSTSKNILSKYGGTKKKAFVVAAFGMKESSQKKKQMKPKFPETKQLLLDLWDANLVEPVHFTKFIHGHYQTNYTRWRNSTDVYQIKWYTHYEPYVIVRTADTPVYDGAFMERYFDKVSHILQLYKAGFEFWAIPNVYMVHMPHAVSKKTMARYWRCATDVYKKFVAKLETLHPT